MMSVKEYALDMGKTVNEVIEILKKLGYTVNQDDMLDDEMIISLDNELQNDNEDFTDSYLEELEEVTTPVKKNVEPIKQNKVKSKKKNDVSKKDNFKRLKKEIYKHKEKFSGNSNEDDQVILFKEGMTVGDLANLLVVSPAEVIKKLFNLGIMMTVNNNIDFTAAEIVVSDYGRELKREETRNEANFEEFEIIDNAEDLVSRPPVVTIMGHVDHGKTTLLDTIRKTNVVSSEAGGITQHIGAYQIDYKGRKITFIDTPGHAAFTEMRARGAAITDIVIIIVAADDGVMPQTKEAIDHAKAAGVPIIVAINKIDKPTANPDRVMTEMSQNGITPDIWGGDVMFVNISAAVGTGIDDLLERILLLADLNNYTANPNRYASGTVIEARQDKNAGSVATLLVQNGTLRLGDAIVVGTTYGKVRTLKNDRLDDLVEALPSMPVSITGLNDVPSAGDKFFVFETEKKAHAVCEQRINQLKEKNNQKASSLSLDDLFNQINAGIKEINIVLKADVKGSEEAVKNSLLKINVEGVKVNVIRSGVGAISESDVLLASASNAIIIGFNIRPDSKMSEFAKEKGVDIRMYNIIYKVVEEIESAMRGILDPEYEEKILGEAEIRKLFKFSKVGTIAGCYVTSGVIKRDAKARIIRDGVVIYDGNINSVAREKDQVKEVKQGLECGITIENYNDLKEKDIIEAYEMVVVK